jgi:translation initiation factor 2 alpha subunit (eIF-2alpha)
MEIDAVVLAVDRKKRIITLSIKAREHKEEETALEAYGAAGTAAATTKLGDLLKPQLDVSEMGKRMTKSELIELIARKQPKIC